MIWPWSELKYLRQQLDYHKSQMAHYEKWHRIYEKLYLERLLRAMLGLVVFAESRAEAGQP